MGAWGAKNFENDSAMDWVADFVNNAYTEYLHETLSAVIVNDEYIEVDEASAALAAAEIVAALKGKPSSDFPVELKEILQNMKIDSEVEQLAINAVKKVFQDSELKELWEEGEDEDWTEVVADLLNRLS